MQPMQTSHLKNERRKESVILALSGGVDSAAAAVLMQEKGYACRGLMMGLYSQESSVQKERHRRDIRDARRLCEKLKIPFEYVDLAERFEEEVIAPFVRTYQAGKTPNPCLYCNKELKFGSLVRLAEERGSDYLATGHYARVRFNPQTDKYELLQAVNKAKDQSYVLYQLNQDILAKLKLPLGELSKEEVRRAARQRHLEIADKADSQDICFIPDGDYAAFIERYSNEKARPGPFVLKDGTVIGEHQGLIHYTVGQRKGLGISWSEALYVLALDPARNAVVLGTKEESFRDQLRAEKANYISGSPPEDGTVLTVRTRYRQEAQKVRFYAEDAGHFRLEFEKPQPAVTPGQAAVLYDGEIVRGGGLIL